MVERLNIHSISLKGMLSKRVININGEKYIVKSSSYGCTEAISEVIVSKLLDILDIEHIEYKYYGATNDCGYINHNCICKYMRIDSKYRKLGLYKYCVEDAISKGIQCGCVQDEYILDCIDNFDYKVRNKIYQMLHIDAIIGNTDRNYTNIEVLLDSKNNVVDIFPIFDNGASLLHDKDISGLYSHNSSLPFRITHDNQMGLIKRLGYRGDIGDTRRILDEFKKTKELELLESYRETVIDYFAKRLNKYGRV